MAAEPPRVALVAQPGDRVLPPVQSSVGACTFGLARAFAASRCEVVAFAVSGQPGGADPGTSTRVDGAAFSFVPVPPWDGLLARLWGVGSERRQRKVLAGGVAEPYSTSRLRYPSWGRRVARDLGRERWDLIHIQHSPQYVPAVRARNPEACVVVQRHSELFSQSNAARMEGLLEQADLIATVSDYLNARTRARFPTLAERVVTVPNGVEIDELARPRTYRRAGDGR